MSTNRIDIQGYEGSYMACSSGRIWSVERINENGRTYGGKYLSEAVNKLGYSRVLLSINGVVKSWSVHRLIAMAFHGATYELHLQVNHIDGCRSNNRPENLEWVTASENKKHGFRIGITPRSTPAMQAARSASGKASRVLSSDDVFIAMNMHKSGIGQRPIAKFLGVSKSTIAGIVNRKTYLEHTNV